MSMSVHRRLWASQEDEQDSWPRTYCSLTRVGAPSYRAGPGPASGFGGPPNPPWETHHSHLGEVDQAVLRVVGCPLLDEGQVGEVHPQVRDTGRVTAWKQTARTEEVHSDTGASPEHAAPTRALRGQRSPCTTRHRNSGPARPSSGATGVMWLGEGPGVSLASEASPCLHGHSAQTRPQNPPVMGTAVLSAPASAPVPRDLLLPSPGAGASAGDPAL